MVDSPDRSRHSRLSQSSQNKIPQRPASGGSYGQRLSSRPQTAQNRQSMTEQDDHLPDINKSASSKQSTAMKRMQEGPVRADPFASYATVEARDLINKQSQKLATASHGRIRNSRASSQHRSVEVTRPQDVTQMSGKKQTLDNQDLQLLIANDDIQSHATIDDRLNAFKDQNLVITDQTYNKDAEIQNQNLRQIQTKTDVNEPPTPITLITPAGEVLKKQTLTYKQEEQKAIKQPAPDKITSFKKPKLSTASIEKQTPTQNSCAWPRKKPITSNQFKSMSDSEVLNFLTTFCAKKIGFTSADDLKPPADLDSTDSIDSFIMALLQVNSEGITYIESDDLESLHLAAGTRNQFCRQMIQSVINYQNKESVFKDALGFFQESIVKLLNVTAQNEQRCEQIEILDKIKEELTMKMFDYQKKLTETSTSLLKLRQTEFEQSKLLAATKKQLEHKKAECESLNYMIKNNVASKALPSPLETMTENNINSNGNSRQNNSNVIEVDTEYNMMQSQLTTFQQDVQMPQQALVENTQVEHYQQQIQRLSIENRQHQENINSMQISFENKDRLIQHLENSISQMLVEKEHNLIRLKSEIILLQTKVSESDNTYKTKLVQMRQRVELDEKTKVQLTVDALKNDIEVQIRKSDDQIQKNQRLKADYKSLSEEFQNYRKEKAIQESNAEVYLKDLELRYKTVSEQFNEYSQIMSNKLYMFDSQSLQKQHESEALYLRLKYLRQSAETLVRQKNFLMETIEKSRQELQNQVELLEESMTSQNKSKSYLISVEKATKQTRNISELGENALLNIENIIKFLKVEKMYELVFQAEPPVPSTYHSIDKDNNKNNNPHLTLSPNSEHHIKTEPAKEQLPGEDQKIGVVQEMLDKLKLTLDVPIQFKAKVVSVGEIKYLEKQSKEGKGKNIVKNEEYYLEHCPIELCSILLKFIIQQLVTVDVVQSVEQIPFSISRLIFVANSKSDISVERELFDFYLFESKKIIDDEYASLIDQVKIHDKLKTILPQNAGRTLQTQPAKNPPHDKLKSPRGSYNILSMQAFEDKEQIKFQQLEKDATKTDEKQKDQFSDLEKEKFVLQSELQKLQMVLVNQKKKSKEIQMSLAGEIVVLQEQIEQQSFAHQKQIDDKEYNARQEIEKFKLGCLKRETQLQSHLQKIQDRNLELEIRNSQIDKASQISLKARQYMNEGALQNGAAYQSHNEILRSKKSLHSIIHEVEEETSATVKQIKDQFNTFKQNVDSYIDLRESTRSSVSLVFEVNEQTQQLINESILTLYMSKLYQLPKDKIKVLSSTNFNKEVNQDSRDLRKKIDQVAYTKVLIEIIQETDRLEKQQASIQAAINDGSSLLFDISPSYMCFNLGNCGLATKNKLQSCHILAKSGLMLDGCEFIVTLLRHNVEPHVFMIVAINMKIGQEFVLELNQKDTLTLINGDVSLLESDDCPEVQELIIANLALVQISQDKAFYLTCEYRLYFNEVWQSKFVSKAGQASVQQNQSVKNNNLSRFDISVKERALRKSIYSMSTVRDSVVKQGIPDQNQKTLLNYETQLKTSKHQQTDFETSIFYEANTPVFQTMHKISDQVNLNVQVQCFEMSKITQVTVQDINSQSEIKFWISDNKIYSDTRIQLNRDSAEDLRNITDLDQDYKSQENLYFIQSQVMLIADNHLVLVSIERQINQGILIKMHDMKYLNSDQISLVKKSNGQMVRVLKSNQLQLSDQFRQLVLNLAFGKIEDQQEILQQYFVRAEDKLLQEGYENVTSPEQALVNEAVIQKPSELENKQQRAFAIDALRLNDNQYARHQNNPDSFKQLKERGRLIFRDCMQIRVGGNIRISDDDHSNIDYSAISGSNNFKITQSLCSLYFKEQSVFIEIFLYQSHKISITSSVPVHQLFVGSPFDLTANQRAEYVQNMLEKLFVVEVDGKFQMKVDSEAESVNVIISRQKERDHLEMLEKEKNASKPKRQ